MEHTRRNLALMLTALASGRARGQNYSKRLPSQAFVFDKLPAKPGKTGISHPVMTGETHTGYPIEVHITELNAGASPHPPHQHLHEEMFFIKQGSLDATVNGNTTRLTPGSVFYINSNDLHGVHNPGPDRAVYCVVALGPDS